MSKLEDLRKNSNTPFFQSSEGKKVIVFFLVLVVVVGAGLYIYFIELRNEEGNVEESEKDPRQEAEHPDLESLEERWNYLLATNIEPGDDLRGGEAYRKLLADLSEVPPGQFLTRNFERFQDPTPLDTLRRSESDTRGNVYTYGGIVRAVRGPMNLKLPNDQQLSLVRLWVEEEDRQGIYEIHLVNPPAERIVPGQTRVEGLGVFMNNIGTHQVPSPDDGEEPIKMDDVLLFLSLQLEKVNTVEQEGGGEEETKEEDEPGEMPSIDNYQNRQLVEAHWNRMLGPLDDETVTPYSSSIFHRMLNEVERVERDQIEEWARANESIKPEDLLEGAPQHRGKSISFKGQVLKGNRLSLPGRPREGKGAWEYYVYDPDHNLTYRVRTLEEAEFTTEMGTKVQGAGVYFHSPTYRTQGKPDQESPSITLVGWELLPRFEESTNGSSSGAVLWLYVLLGGMAAVFLLLFLGIVFFTGRKDAKDRGTLRERLRKQRSEKGPRETPKRSEEE